MKPLPTFQAKKLIKHYFGKKTFIQIGKCKKCKHPEILRTDGVILLHDTNCNCNAKIRKSKIISWDSLTDLINSKKPKPAINNMSVY